MRPCSAGMRRPAFSPRNVSPRNVSPLLSLPATLAAALLTVATPLLLAGCGGAAGSAGAEAKSSDVALFDAQSATSELDRAEGEITALFGPPSTPLSAQAAPTATFAAPPPNAVSAEPTAPPTPAERPAAAAKVHTDSADQGPAPDACSIACRALASMERAANHLCGLAGDAEPSCTSARARVKSAEDRVAARCTCR